MNKKKKPKNLRKNSGKKNGGQLGHTGKTLEKSESPDFTKLHHTPDICECGQHLDHVEVATTESRQVFDIPEAKIEVTEHVAQVKVCPICGKKQKGCFPDDVK